MDGQHTDGEAQRASAPTDEEIAELRRFLGVHTDADRPGVYRATGTEPDNVRPLTSRRQRPNREID